MEEKRMKHIGVLNKKANDLFAYNLWLALRKDETIADHNNKNCQLYYQLDEYIKNQFDDSNALGISIELLVSDGEATITNVKKTEK